MAMPIDTLLVLFYESLVVCSGGVLFSSVLHFGVAIQFVRPLGRFLRPLYLMIVSMFASYPAWRLVV